MSVAKVGTIAGVVLVAACSAILDFSSSPTGGSDGGDADAAADRDALEPTIPDASDRPDAIRVDASPDCQIPPLGTDLYDATTGNCYVFFESFGQQYTDARQGCESLGGHIAVISSRREFDLLLPRLLAGTYWIGFDDLAEEGTFTWAAAEGSTFTNWRDGEPNDGGTTATPEDCAVMYGNYTGEFASYVGGWNDVDCTRGMYTICEQPPAR